MNKCFHHFCPRGHRVIGYCNETLNTVSCGVCPADTFSNRRNDKKICQRCQICRRKEIIKATCNSTSNTKCQCRPGYIYHPPKPCFKCPKGTIAKNNKCLNTTVVTFDTVNKTTVNSTGTHVFAYGLTGGIGLLILVIIAFFCIFYQRRNRRHLLHENGANTPDVLKNIKTPPLPPKMSRRRTENEYEAAPQVCRPLIEKKLSSLQLPFSLVHEMNTLLSGGYSKNYKHLADKLGYSYMFIKSLETKPQPLETLLDHYMSSENPTKERLYEALLAIDRPDVAQKVWAEL